MAAGASVFLLMCNGQIETLEVLRLFVMFCLLPLNLFGFPALTDLSIVVRTEVTTWPRYNALYPRRESEVKCGIKLLKYTYQRQQI